MEEMHVIEGKFTHIRYRHELNGFTVATFKMNDHQEKSITVTGVLPIVDENALYECKGYYVEHARYGMQFQIEEIRYCIPSDEEALVRYFSGPIFSGIGVKTAQKIVDALGLNAIQLIQEDPSVIDGLFKKDDKRKKVIIEGVFQHDSIDDHVLFYNKIGLSIRQLEKVQVAYGEEAPMIIQNNPYQLIEDIDGIGFKTADKIASTLGFEKDHPYRCKALLVSCVLDACIRSGNSFILMDDFKGLLSKVLKKEQISFDAFDFEGCFEQLLRERFLVREEERIYHYTQYDAEKGIAHFLHEFPYVANFVTSIPNLDEEISYVEEELNIVYDEKQKEAIRMFFEKPFSILTGGPGTGKTTIVKGILSIYKKHYPMDQIMLSAPTGRASKRLGECSDTLACTLHRLLKWDLESNTFLMNEEEPLLLDCLIIDEFSMVDQWLFYNLCKASHRLRKILIIGDQDQLPSVGIGSVLKDCIESQKFPITALHKIFRQSEGSDVVELAHAMKEGSLDILNHGKEVAFFECPNTQLKDQILKITQAAFDKGYNEQEIQVLSPMYSGVSGIDQLNLSMQKMCNPPTPYHNEIKVGYRTFREGDKVLQLKNMPDDDVYNGDIGQIIEIIKADDDVNHQNRIIVDFDGIIVDYTMENFSLLTHAYCISIHKSQGSEYPIVILPIAREHMHMLNLRLIYTAITRAKKSLVLLGNRETLQQAILKRDEGGRMTTLMKRILE